MQRTNSTLLTCILLALTCNLNAQETSREIPDVEAKVQASDLDDVLASPSDVVIEPAADDSAAAAVERLKADAEAVVDDAETAGDLEDVVDDESSEEDLVEAIDSEANELTSDDETEDSDVEEEEEEEGPVFVSVDEDGRLIGLATATVAGEIVPIEANVSLVRDGVLLSKILADEDGSFAFQDVGPGDYNMFGSASSYCGQQALTVLPSNSCTVCEESVGLQLSQGGGCYSGLSGAPVASFSSNTGGFFSSGGGFVGGGGGGLVGGGGGAAGGTGLRLLAVGGVATAIAVGGSDDDDVVSPSE